MSQETEEELVELTLSCLDELARDSLQTGDAGRFTWGYDDIAEIWGDSLVRAPSWIIDIFNILGWFRDDLDDAFGVGDGFHPTSQKRNSTPWRSRPLVIGSPAPRQGSRGGKPLQPSGWSATAERSSSCARCSASTG